MQQPSAPPAGAKTKSSTAPVIIAIIAGAILVGVVVIGILASLAIFGVRKYLVRAKEAEGMSVVSMIAQSAVACAARDTDRSAGRLPPTTEAVPATLAQVSNRKYMSSTADWSSPGWRALKFSLSAPQYFQYRWLLTGPLEGTAEATADFDGDGSPDVTFEVAVTCTSPGACTAGQVVEKR